VAVAVGPDLVEHALLVAVEAADAGDVGDALGEERLGEVESRPSKQSSTVQALCTDPSRQAA
jgi:hypothetical protein